MVRLASRFALSKVEVNEMLPYIVVLGFLFLAVLIKKNKPSPPRYLCIIEKRFPLPNCETPELETNKITPFSYSLAELNEPKLIRKIYLPFPPQIGMEVSDVFELPNIRSKKEERETRTFTSGKLEQVRWDNNRFVCGTAAHQVDELSNYGNTILAFIRIGWKATCLGSFGEDRARDALNAFEISMKATETKKGEALLVDKEILDDIKACWEARKNLML